MQPRSSPDFVQSDKGAALLVQRLACACFRLIRLILPDRHSTDLRARASSSFLSWSFSENGVSTDFASGVFTNMSALYPTTRVWSPVVSPELAYLSTRA